MYKRLTYNFPKHEYGVVFVTKSVAVLKYRWWDGPISVGLRLVSISLLGKLLPTFNIIDILNNVCFESSAISVTHMLKHLLKIKETNILMWEHVHCVTCMYRSMHCPVSNLV